MTRTAAVVLGRRHVFRNVQLFGGSKGRCLMTLRGNPQLGLI